MTAIPIPNDSNSMHGTFTGQHVMQILLVDDDDVASESVIRTMRKSGIGHPVLTAEDGQVALDILRGVHQYKKISPPYIVLLDLNMPRMNGFEFLETIRADAKLKSTIVFVLTTSAATTDRSRAYQHNIAGYLIKGGTSAQFGKALALLDDYANVISFPE